MGVGLAMDALAVSLTLGAVGWSCPKSQSESTGTEPQEQARRQRPLLQRLPFFRPVPAAPVCTVCRSANASCTCGCGHGDVSGRTPLTGDKIALTAAFFGIFQAMMPAIGWFGSGLCGGIVQKLGRFAAGGLLAFVAVQMLVEGLSKEDAGQKRSGICSLRQLIALSFATSIDAFLVGVSYACLGRTDIGGDVLVIGAVTAAISAAGCVSGRMFGNRLGSRSSILGGVVLTGIAVKIMFFG